MSDYYDECDQEFDSAFLKEIDAIEEAASNVSAPAPDSKVPNPSSTTSSSKPTFKSTHSYHTKAPIPSSSTVFFFKPASNSGPPKPDTSQQPAKPPSKPAPAKQDTSFDEYDISLDIDASELAKLDEFISDSYAGKAQPIAGPSRPRQTTLDGSVYHPPSAPPPQQQRSSSTTSKTLERTKSAGSRGNGPLFGFSERRTKVWDRTQFAETGFRSKPAERLKEKGKGKENVNGDFDKEEDGEIEFEQFPTPQVTTTSWPPKMRLKPECLACKNWIYPLNRPRRDYQFNIARNCLFQNTLVALPTGLGKTFIAGVIMLNFYKWFPSGKIIFVAPTKPLVAQQITASHEVCGIPGRDAAELTGNVAKHKRSAAWTNKRVLYMTPQTFMNDIQSGLADPLDIILIVIDEAHRGTGDYSYALIVRYMMAHNPHFRILALTATPGNSPEAVQDIVDSLHISHIEIRNEESADLRQYIHKKEVRIHKIVMTDAIEDIKKSLSRVMEPYLKRAREAQLLWNNDPVMLHPFACQQASKKLMASGQGRQLPWAFGCLKILSGLARIMATLIEHSPALCYEALVKFRETLLESSKPQDRILRDQIFKNNDFKRLMEVCEKQAAVGFAPHPKMDMLSAIILEHFLNAQSAENTPAVDGSPAPADSKIMVFVQFRDVLGEVMESLEKHKPIIKPVRFVGQGKDKHGKKGMGQTEQLGVVKRFKNGEFNVLVATSIGEEGLDIGEIDRIVCYDTQKSSIRLLQRIGRTGRKRAGYVDVLLSDPRETRNWDKSQENYTDVQQSIINGNQLELFGDVERLIPDNIEPECLQMKMDIEEYVPPSSTRESPQGKKTKTTKRKRNDDINRNIPLGAFNGFVAASALRPKSKTKKVNAFRPLRDSDVEDESDDEEIAGGIFGPKIASKRSKEKEKLKASGKKSQRSISNFVKSGIPSQLEDDEDDIIIRNGLKGKKGLLGDSSDRNTSLHPSRRSKKTTQESTRGTKGKNVSASDESDEGPRQTQRKRISWLFDSDSDEDAGRPSPPPKAAQKLENPSRRLKGFTSGFQSAKSLQLVELTSSSSSSPSPSPSRSSSPKQSSSGAVVGIDSSSLPAERQSDSEAEAEDLEEGCQSSESEQDPEFEDGVQLEPPEPQEAPESSQNGPEPTFIGRKPKRSKLTAAPPSSPIAETSAAPRRLKRRDSIEFMAPPPVPLSRRTPDKQPLKKKRKLKMTSNPLIFDVEAQHSGDEVSAGSGSDVDMVETEADRAFLTQGEGTQASPSYNQTQAYRMGLMTQVAASGGPIFANSVRRVGAFAGGRTQVPKPIDWSSSPARGSEPDEYEFGTFVVPDDDSILYEQEQSSEA